MFFASGGQADSAPGLATLQQRLEEYVPPKSKSDTKYTQVECDLDNLLDEAASALARLYNHRSRPNVRAVGTMCKTSRAGIRRASWKAGKVSQRPQESSTAAADQ